MNIENQNVEIERDLQEAISLVVSKQEAHRNITCIQDVENLEDEATYRDLVLTRYAVAKMQNCCVEADNAACCAELVLSSEKLMSSLAFLFAPTEDPEDYDKQSWYESIEDEAVDLAADVNSYTDVQLRVRMLQLQGQYSFYRDMADAELKAYRQEVSA